MTVIDIDAEAKKLPTRQKCKYDDNEADRRLIWAEGAAYVPVCSDACESRARRQVKDNEAIIRPITRDAPKAMIVRLEVKAGWFEDDADELIVMLERKGLNFHWDESKVTRDKAGRFAKYPGYGLSKLLDFPSNYPWPKAEIPAKALPQPKQIKPVSLRKGDVVGPTASGVLITLTSAPKLSNDGTWALDGIKFVQPAGGGGPNSSPGTEAVTWYVPGDGTVLTTARTPQPKATAQAKKDKAALAASMGGKEEAQKPVIEKVDVHDLKLDDVLVDASDGDQFRVTQVTNSGTDSKVFGVKLNDPNHDEVLLGQWKHGTMLTRKVEGAAGVATVAPSNSYQGTYEKLPHNVWLYDALSHASQPGLLFLNSDGTGVRVTPAGTTLALPDAALYLEGDAAKSKQWTSVLDIDSDTAKKYAQHGNAAVQQAISDGIPIPGFIDLNAALSDPLGGLTQADWDQHKGQWLSAGGTRLIIDPEAHTIVSPSGTDIPPTVISDGTIKMYRRVPRPGTYTNVSDGSPAFYVNEQGALLTGGGIVMSAYESYGMLVGYWDHKEAFGYLPPGAEPKPKGYSAVLGAGTYVSSAAGIKFTVEPSGAVFDTVTGEYLSPGEIVDFEQHVTNGDVSKVDQPTTIAGVPAGTIPPVLTPNVVDGVITATPITEVPPAGMYHHANGGEFSSLAVYADGTGMYQSNPKSNGLPFSPKDIKEVMSSGFLLPKVMPGIYKYDGHSLVVGKDGTGMSLQNGNHKSWTGQQLAVLMSKSKLEWQTPLIEDLPAEGEAEDLVVKPTDAAAPYLGAGFAGKYKHNDPAAMGFTIEFPAGTAPGGAAIAKVTWSDGTPMKEGEWALLAPTLTPDGGPNYTRVATNDTDPDLEALLSHEEDIATAQGRWVHQSGKILSVHGSTATLVGAKGTVHNLTADEAVAELKKPGWSPAVAEVEAPVSVPAYVPWKPGDAVWSKIVNITGSDPITVWMVQHPDDTGHATNEATAKTKPGGEYWYKADDETLINDGFTEHENVVFEPKPTGPEDAVTAAYGGTQSPWANAGEAYTLPFNVPGGAPIKVGVYRNVTTPDSDDTTLTVHQDGSATWKFPNGSQKYDSIQQGLYDQFLGGKWLFQGPAPDLGVLTQPKDAEGTDFTYGSAWQATPLGEANALAPGVVLHVNADDSVTWKYTSGTPDQTTTPNKPLWAKYQKWIDDGWIEPAKRGASTGAASAFYEPDTPPGGKKWKAKDSSGWITQDADGAVLMTSASTGDQTPLTVEPGSSWQLTEDLTADVPAPAAAAAPDPGTVDFTQGTPSWEAFTSNGHDIQLKPGDKVYESTGASGAKVGITWVVHADLSYDVHFGTEHDQFPGKVNHFAAGEMPKDKGETMTIAEKLVNGADDAPSATLVANIPGGSSITPGFYIVEGNIDPAAWLEVFPTGDGLYHWKLGGGGTESWSKADVDKHLGKLQSVEIAMNGIPTGDYWLTTSQHGAWMTVDKFGQGTYHLPPGKGTAGAMKDGDPWGFVGGDTINTLKPKYGTEPPPNMLAAAKVPDGSLTVDDATANNLNPTLEMPADLVAQAQILDYPADYPWPIVDGAPPAKKMDPPSQVKGVSLRLGDVVNMADWGYGIGSVSKIKKVGSSYALSVKIDDDSTLHITLLDGDTITAVARTPQPKVTAAAKKAKAKLLADYGPSGTPSAPSSTTTGWAPVITEENAASLLPAELQSLWGPVDTAWQYNENNETAKHNTNFFGASMVLHSDGTSHIYKPATNEVVKISNVGAVADAISTDAWSPKPLGNEPATPPGGMKFAASDGSGWVTFEAGGKNGMIHMASGGSSPMVDDVAYINASENWKLIDPLPVPVTGSSPTFVHPLTHNKFVPGSGVSGGGTKTYAHPQGGFITVYESGTLIALDKHGKTKSTSATAEKLAAGHGKWVEVVLDSPTTPSAPSTPATDPYAAVQPGMSADVAAAAYTGDLIAGWAPGTYTYKQQDVVKIVVEPNGKATHYNQHGTPADISPNGGKYEKWLKESDQTQFVFESADTTPAPAAASSKLTVGMSAIEAAAAHDGPKVGGWAPGFYKYNGSGLQATLTITPDGQAWFKGSTESPEDVSETSKHAGYLAGQLTGGQGEKWKYAGPPDVQATAAAATAATVGAPSTTAVTHTYTPGMLSAGKYTDKGGSGAVMVVKADGTVWATTDGSTGGSGVTAHITHQGSLDLFASQVAGGVWAHTPDAVGTGPVLTPKTLAAAKPKPTGSKFVTSPGAVLVLPNGGSITVAKAGGKFAVKKYLGFDTVVQWQDLTDLNGKKMPNNMPAIVFVGEPSADTADEYLYTMNDPNTGQPKVYAIFSPPTWEVQWVPKAALSKKGATTVGSKPVVSKQTVTTNVPKDTVNAASPAAAPTTSSGWKQVGPQAGSNKGGMFEAPNGDRYYIKAMTQDRVDNEVLAARLYALSGVKIPEVSKFEKLTDDLGLGKGPAIASKIVDGKKNLSSKYTDPAYRKKVIAGFAVDAWLANWDAVGTGMDNMIEDPDGDPLRVDVGGSMLFRAQGTPKGADFGDTVGETTSMIAGNGLDSGKVFGKVTKDELRASFLATVANVWPEQIDALVDKHVTNPENAAMLKARLKARRLDLAKQAGVADSELAENAAAGAEVDLSPQGGMKVPYVSGDTVQSDKVTLENTDLWFHTKIVKATQVPLGAVLYVDSPGIPNIPDSTTKPWVVTKIAPKVDGNGAGKDGLWGKLGGEGDEQFMFIMVPSSGERNVVVQTDAPPGWKPPPPPLPPEPGVALDIAGKFKPPSAKGSPDAVSGLQWMLNNLNRSKEIEKAFGLANEQQKAALASVGWTTAQKFRESMLSLSSQWDGSSNDSNAPLLAFHHAVAVEFGLEDVVAWPKEQNNIKMKQDVEQHFAKYGAAYQAAARLMWQNTQDRLKERGIEYVELWRGFSFASPSSPSDDPAPAPPWAWTNGVHTDVKLRPLSSFAWYNNGWGNTMIKVTVPIEAIFATGATGPGHYGGGGEKEVVVLGLSGIPANVTGAHSPPAGYTPEKFYQQHAVWAPGASQMQKKGLDGLPVEPQYPTDETEDWIKIAAGYWPFRDDEGDEAVSVAEMLDLFPDVNVRALLDLPVGRFMPPTLRDEILGIDDDEDGMGPFARTLAASTA